MVNCRCGCVFENDRMDSHVMCPRCRRIYANRAPDMFHPVSVVEKQWQCERCGAINDASCAGLPRRICALCKAARPGVPAKWY